jgi:hypothetical protein
VCSFFAFTDEVAVVVRFRSCVDGLHVEDGRLVKVNGCKAALDQGRTLALDSTVGYFLLRSNGLSASAARLRSREYGRDDGDHSSDQPHPRGGIHTSEYQ